MKRRTAGLLIGAAVCTMLLSGCGESKTVETAAETAEEEKAETEAKEQKEKTTEESEEKSETSEAVQEAEETLQPTPTATPEPEIELVKVGVLLPEGENAAEDELALSEALTEAGYEALVMTADSSDAQAAQFAELVDSGAEALIVSPVDGYELTEAVEAAGEKKIPVFSYDNLIMNTAELSYHTTFDMRKAGNETAEALIKYADIKKAQEAKTPLTIEFLMGSPDDSGALFYFNGIMEGLREYFDDGTLICRSGRTAFDANGILRWSEAAAKDTMKEILTEFYAEEGAPDVICTGADAFTYGILELLEEEKITVGSGRYPVITGLGSEADAVKNIAEGEIAFTLFMDRKDLAEKCVKMVSARISGKKVEAENYNQYDNGKRIIGTETCEAKIIDRDNYEILIDYGVYAPEEIRPAKALPTPHTTL